MNDVFTLHLPVSVVCFQSPLKPHHPLHPLFQTTCLHRHRHLLFKLAPPHSGYSASPGGIGRTERNWKTVFDACEGVPTNYSGEIPFPRKLLDCPRLSSSPHFTSRTNITLWTGYLSVLFRLGNSVLKTTQNLSRKCLPTATSPGNQPRRPKHGTILRGLASPRRHQCRVYHHDRHHSHRGALPILMLVLVLLLGQHRPSTSI